nr:unnamed protein product [Callosobruchus analis]CAI5850459.1 unnamed protein product [Callosobruchus analis]
MISNILVLLFIFGTSQCNTIKKDATNNTQIDTPHALQVQDIDINGKDVSIPPITDVTGKFKLHSTTITHVPLTSILTFFNFIYIF